MSHWRDTARTVRIGMFDARIVIPLVAWLVLPNKFGKIGTMLLLMTMAGIVLDVLAKRKGTSIERMLAYSAYICAVTITGGYIKKSWNGHQHIATKTQIVD